MAIVRITNQNTYKKNDREKNNRIKGNVKTQIEIEQKIWSSKNIREHSTFILKKSTQNQKRAHTQVNTEREESSKKNQRFIRKFIFVI